MSSKNVLLTGVLAISLVCQNSFAAAAVTAESAVDRENFSLEESRNFMAASPQSTTAATMTVAQVPDEFDCPLFSNSPYNDILNAIDSLQTSINMFPKCDAQDKTSDVMTTMSSDLRQKILDARSIQDGGESKKFSASATQILSSASRLQDVITKASTSADASCYKSDDSKKLIFSINDTFQSIAPLALDFVSKNPGLSSALAPYLPVVAGAQAISKGISVLEFAMKYVPTLDMSVPENRMAVIKNTCSFMKVYNKVEYLTLDRASRLKKVNQDFDLKIQASREFKRTVIDSLGGMSLASNPIDTTILKIKDNVAKYSKALNRANDELSLQDGKTSDISACSVVKTLFNMKLSEGILTDLVKLAELTQRSDQIAFKKTKLEEFNSEMNKSEVFKNIHQCSDIGNDWIGAQKEALTELTSMLNAYDSTNSQGSAQEEIAKIKLNREDKKTTNLQENKAKLNIFADLSVFEPGELAKRMHGMPKYLFNGPDGNWFSKLKKNGPVYDLLVDNENSFNQAMSRFSTQVSFFKAFERTQLMKEYSNRIPTTPEDQNIFYKKMEYYQNSFSHVSTKFVGVGSYEHKQLCDKSKLAIKAYVEATDQLISSEYLCKMIDPVLKEPEVSMWLRRYCQNTKGLVTNVDVKAGYKELARPLFVKNGPKTQIEFIMQKYDNLNCE